MTDPEPRQIDWASAQMKDGRLTVELTGKGTKAWRARFENVLRLLDTPHSTWGDVRLNKNVVKVTEVQQGEESGLRHFLESIVLQANSDTQPQALGSAHESEKEDSKQDDDEQTAARFRAFAQEDKG